MISVCVATHNGERYIKEQLESILSQLSDGDDVVVSDDGSTDSTLQVIDSINDNRIKVLHYQQSLSTCHMHKYVCCNFQNALIHAKGDYIFLSDQDDIWLPNKVDVCMQYLQNSDLVIHDFRHIDNNLKVLKSYNYGERFKFGNYLLLRRGKYYGCAMAFRRHMLDYAIPFPKSLLVHDIWIGLLAEALGRVSYIPEPLLLYRNHHQNTSTTSNSLCFKLFYRIEFVFHLISRVVSCKIR